MNSKQRTVIGLGIMVVAMLSLRAQAATMIVSDDDAYGQQLQSVLSQDDKACKVLSMQEFCNLTALDADLLVIADASKLPAQGEVKDLIEKYLAGGKNLIALNGPLWHEHELEVRRQPKSAIPSKDFRQEMDHVIYDFSSFNPAEWSRGSSGLKTPITYETVDSGNPFFPKALSVNMSFLTNWETYSSPTIQGMFPDDCELLVLYARGDERTVEVGVELDEQDGTRWIATIPVTQEWQLYVLDPKKDFRIWPPWGRTGGPDPKKVQRVSFQVSMSHTASYGGGRHLYQIGAVGTKKRPPSSGASAAAFDIPVWDSLCPEYKFFRSSEVGSIQSAADQVIVPSAKFPHAKVVFNPHVRASVVGFDKKADTRWEPLLTVQNDGGQWRGHPGVMTIHVNGKYSRGIWASFGIEDQNWYRDPRVMQAIKQLANRMRTGVFLADGGTDALTCFEDQELKLGANVINVSSQERGDLKIQAKIRSAQNGKEITAATWPLSLNSAERKRFFQTFKLPLDQGDAFNVEVALFQGQDMIDVARHDLHILRNKKEKHYVENRDGDFYVNGRRLWMNGVNYWPSSGGAVDDFGIFNFWLSRRAYCGAAVKRDIQNMVNMNINAVTILAGYDSVDNGNLLDFLRLADEAGLKVNIATPPSPEQMTFRWKELSDLLKRCRASQQDCIFAYDIAWEPAMGGYAQRRQWDPQWRSWIESHYGSLAQATGDWQFELPKDEKGNVTSPSDLQLSQSGAWNAMVAAYRRFIDTLLYEKYSFARRKILAIDDKHMVSFRMHETGNPTFSCDSVMEYDWPYLAGAVDMFEPEAYGRLGEWNEIRPGIFVGDYATWADPRKPAVWAEVGVSSWSKSKMVDDLVQKQYQAEYIRDMYRMFESGNCDGVFFWFFMGGFRLDEVSDYGIIEPDGTDRPVSKVIREMGKKLIASPPAHPAVQKWLVFDRDKYAEGMPGFYNEYQKDYWQAVDAGLKVGLKTEATGTDSSNCSLVAIGNKPPKPNCCKYLDGFYDRITINGPDGSLVEIKPDVPVEGVKQYPLLATIEITNLGEPTWLSPKQHEKAGVVYLVIKSDNGAERLIPLPEDTPRFKTAEFKDVTLLEGSTGKPQELKITLRAKDRVDFGPVIKCIVKP